MAMTSEGSEGVYEDPVARSSQNWALAVCEHRPTALAHTYGKALECVGEVDGVVLADIYGERHPSLDLANPDPYDAIIVHVRLNELSLDV
jgi:hypothetical protein